MESKNSLELFPSQICTSFACNSLAFVEPRTNHSNSSTTPLQKTRLVVSNGNFPIIECYDTSNMNKNFQKIYLPFLRLNRIWAPKIDLVPVPVRSVLTLPLFRMFLMRFKYWFSSCYKWIKISKQHLITILKTVNKNNLNNHFWKSRDSLVQLTDFVKWAPIIILKRWRHKLQLPFIKISKFWNCFNDISLNRFLKLIC